MVGNRLFRRSDAKDRHLRDRIEQVVPVTTGIVGSYSGKDREMHPAANIHSHLIRSDCAIIGDDPTNRQGVALMRIRHQGTTDGWRQAQSGFDLVNGPWFHQMLTNNFERLRLIAESQLDRRLAVACSDLLPYHLRFNSLL
jgi:hypothetical protein